MPRILDPKQRRVRQRGLGGQEAASPHGEAEQEHAGQRGQQPHPKDETTGPTVERDCALHRAPLLPTAVGFGGTGIGVSYAAGRGNVCV